MNANTIDQQSMTKKSGKGASHGVVSELTAFLHVKPGCADLLREACKRFIDRLKSAPPHLIQRFGLQDMRLVVFDNGTRLLWATSFETDWDPYIDDSFMTFGGPTWGAWLQYTEEYNGEGDGDTAAVKKLIQSAQVRASAFFRAVPDLTVPQIYRNERLKQAFDEVLDAPGAEAALSNPVLKPLLEQASA